MTKAQKWARERNTDKFRIKGILANMTALIKSSKALTREERRELTEIVFKINGIINRWKGYNEMSKEKYLKDIK